MEKKIKDHFSSYENPKNERPRKVFDVPNHEIEIVKPIIMHNMKTAIKTEVPIMVEIGTGLNWLEAH